MLKTKLCNASPIPLITNEILSMLKICLLLTVLSSSKESRNAISLQLKILTIDFTMVFHFQSCISYVRTLQGNDQPLYSYIPCTIIKPTASCFISISAACLVCNVGPKVHLMTFKVHFPFDLAHAKFILLH